MAVIGCLLLVILPLTGVTAGGVLAGPEGAKWGAVAGLGIALFICAMSAYALVKIGRRR